MKITEIKHQWRNALSYGNKPARIVLHHSASKTGDAPTFHKWHLANDWAGIGYHYVVLKTGEIQRGRPEKALGVHCPGQNSTSIGICAVGHYGEEKEMPKAQMNSLVELIKDIRSRYSKTMEIKGHRDFYNTACPGKYYPMDEIRRLADDAPATPVQRALKLGMTGENVLKMQKDLIELGYNLGKSGADGSFGNDTRLAVLLFQNLNRLEQDASFGPASRTKCNELLALGKKTATLNPKTIQLRSTQGGGLIDNIPEGTAVRVVKVDGDWTKIWYGTKEGWVLSSQLK